MPERCGHLGVLIMDQLRSFFSAQGFLGQAVLLVVFAAYLPAFIIYLISSATLISLHRMIFGEPGRAGYESTVARGFGYAAVTAPVLIGAAVAIWETVGVIAVIAGKPLYH